MNTNEEKNRQKENEIDLIELGLRIWLERKFIYKVLVISFVLGLIVAFGSKKEYKAECTFIHDDNMGGSRVSGLLSQFGGLAGLDFSKSDKNGIISPDIYPNIIKSTPFLLELLAKKIALNTADTNVSVSDYFTKISKPSPLGYLRNYTLGLPGLILNTFRPKDIENSFGLLKSYDDEIIRLSVLEEKTLNKLRKSINIYLDEETGIINLEVELSDPIGAAELTHHTYKMLTEYLIDYKIDKAKADFNFIMARHLETKQRYERLQTELANFRDKNLNVTSAFYKTEEERLQNEYQLAFNVHNGLSQQLEQARIKVQEAMPIFKMVNNIKIPLEPSKPNKKIIIVISLFSGLLLSITFIVGKYLIIKILEFKKTI